MTIYGHRHSAVPSPVRGKDAGIGEGVRWTTPDETPGELGDPDVVKMDVEGFEVDILSCGQEPLSRRTDHMIVECTIETVFDQARRLLPIHEFRPLDDRLWVLR